MMLRRPGAGQQGSLVDKFFPFKIIFFYSTMASDRLICPTLCQDRIFHNPQHRVFHKSYELNLNSPEEAMRGILNVHLYL